MVTFPENFVKLANYQGYYVNVKEKQVYSIKSGILRPLADVKPSYFNNQFDGWILSNGRKNPKIRIYREMVERICSEQIVAQTVEVGERRIRRVAKSK